LQKTSQEIHPLSGISSDIKRSLSFIKSPLIYSHFRMILHCKSTSLGEFFLILPAVILFFSVLKIGLRQAPARGFGS